VLLTISTTHRPATDLGYLLHKHPGRLQSFPLNFGQAHVFYPEATDERCTAALLLDVDPVALVRRDGARGGFALDQYVNDRPYVASSFLSVAIGEVYGSALQGKSRERAELASRPLPLAARLAVLPCRGGESLLRGLFEPLGYVVAAQRHTLDARFPEWGESRYFTVDLSATTRLGELLAHLTVLVPVLDDDKHYWVGEDELEKLLRRGKGWLETHPARDLIAERYLMRKRGLVREAIARLAGDEEADPDLAAEARDREEEAIEKPISLHTRRLETVTQVLQLSGAARVLDLGCGEGKLIRRLLEEPQFREIVGVDVSARALEIAVRRLKLDRPPARGHVTLLHGALTYRDRRLAGYDAAAAVEVIEHLEPSRLAAFERALFEFARPGTVVVTTPNADYNVLFPGLPAGRLRHRDHRFEWTRAEFRDWAARVSDRFGYAVRCEGIGPEDEVHGSPTQMAIFSTLGAVKRHPSAARHDPDESHSRLKSASSL
jgi:3' terminal RNA ribose 2'-O-methyltransferase Hen1